MSGCVVCVLFSTFVPGLTVENVSISCACVSCIGKVVYNYLTCSFVLHSNGNEILEQTSGPNTEKIISYNNLKTPSRCQAREKPLQVGVSYV